MTELISVDVSVLGGGPGGYTAAFRAADLGMSVCLIEQQATLGGVCVNVGCIPSKTLLHASSFIEEAKESNKMGISVGEVDIDIEQLRSHKEQTVSKLTSGLASLCKARKVVRVQGRGEFRDRNTLTVNNGEQTIEFKHAIIATGSRPVSLPFAPEDKRIWNSTDALALKEIPSKLLIIGGGIIGMEMAQVYSALGSDITIVEALEQVIPPADKDVVMPLNKTLKKKYQIYTKTLVTDMESDDSGVKVCFEGSKAPESDTFDAVLVAIGRTPNTQNIGLEALDIAVDEKGLIAVDSQMKTAVSNIFAIGDIVAGPMLAHKATHEAKVASEAISGLDSHFKPSSIPSVAYTSPEVAWTGLTEKEAKAKGVEYNVGKVPWMVSGRALSVGAENGVTKVLFDKDSGKIVGAGICGANAGEMIHEISVAIESGATLKTLAHTVHAHPTLAETVAMAAELVDGSVTDMLPQRRR
ncbi:dihydrolipoyl dehydrogenase [Vibrio hannami]|uniref:dihydrolipoyl dehydrogenase n=1 Tax=Vibrio hannami TaxID=2717094 RepID=UPI00240FB685|nr:dihydrolipoyl dehydrogenase [Vibrio hannami]MDG3085083.1 dihydrolipoyl dehydrogenase [Vibrio hannami]